MSASGSTGLLIMAILSVFIAGLMVGRTPEYLGKKIQAAEMKLVVLYILAMPVVVLGFTAASMFVDSVLNVDDLQPRAARVHARSSTRSRRPATTTARRSPGITATTQWMDTTLGLAMLDRPLLPDHPDARDRGLAGPQAARAGDGRARSRPTRRCSSVCVIGVVVIVAGLTFFPRSRSVPSSSSSPSRSACDADLDSPSRPAGAAPTGIRTEHVAVRSGDRAPGRRRQLRQAQPARA